MQKEKQDVMQEKMHSVISRLDLHPEVFLKQMTAWYSEREKALQIQQVETEAAQATLEIDKK